MQSARTLLMFLAIVAIATAAANMAVAETIFAYYPFDGETSGVTPDAVSDNDLTLGSRNGDPAAITAGGMFGNAVTSTHVEGYAELADGDPDFDRTYTKFSVSLWANQNGGWTDDSFGGRYLTGKYSTAEGARGWALNVVGGAVNQISFSAFETGSKYDPNLGLTTNMTNALTADVFHHIVATFDASETTTETQFGIYVDGIRQSGLSIGSKLDPPPATLSQINGDNPNNFQVLNRGVTAYSTTSGGGFVGSIDDYAIATGDVMTDQQVALIHGLGRLAGVSMGDGSSVGGEIGDVLAAYGVQGSATAGGCIWQYTADTGGGTTVGTIGGTVAGGDAYVVLGADGSGVRVVPEPGTFALLLAGLLGFVVARPRERV